MKNNHKSHESHKPHKPHESHWPHESSLPNSYEIYYLSFIIYHYHFEFRRIFNISIFNFNLLPYSTTIVGLFRSGSDITYRYVGRMVRLML